MNDDDTSDGAAFIFGWVFAILFALIGAALIAGVLLGAITLTKWALGI